MLTIKLRNLFRVFSPFARPAWAIALGWWWLVLAQGAQAASVVLQWDPVTTDPAVTGYQVGYGTTSGTATGGPRS
jgi:hypothetical protein